IQQLYKAKALPRMLYAADITLWPHTKKQGKTWKDEKGQAILRQLVSIQRQAAIMIMGAMSTMASDILDIHAALLPAPLEVERQRHRAAT
ncbi:hypothetical protein F5877DRAFT_55130, partial [Lentinula edodes]